MSAVFELPQVFFFILTFTLMVLETEIPGEYVLNHVNSFLSLFDLEAGIIIFPILIVKKKTFHTLISIIYDHVPLEGKQLCIYY